jgi:hypothetical protein
MSIARLVDNAHLLAHVHGQAADAPTPKLTLLSRLMNDFRDAVGSLAKVVAAPKRSACPDAFEPLFAGFARQLVSRRQCRTIDFANSRADRTVPRSFDGDSTCSTSRR